MSTPVAKVASLPAAEPESSPEDRLLSCSEAGAGEATAAGAGEVTATGTEGARSEVELPPATASLVGRGHEWAKRVTTEARPWREFLDTREMSLPAFTGLSERVGKNMQTYHANYALMALSMFAVIALWNIGGVLLFIAGCALLSLLGGGKLLATAQEGKDRKRLIKLGIGFAVLLWVTGVGKILVAGLLYASFWSMLHAVLRNTDRVEFEIEQV